MSYKILIVITAVAVASLSVAGCTTRTTNSAQGAVRFKAIQVTPTTVDWFPVYIRRETTLKYLRKRAQNEHKLKMSKQQQCKHYNLLYLEGSTPENPAGRPVIRQDTRYAHGMHMIDHLLSVLIKRRMRLREKSC